MLKKIIISLLAISLLIGCGSDKSIKKNELVTATAFDKNSTDTIFKAMDKFPKNVQLSIAKIIDGKVHYYGALYSDDSITTIENHTNTFIIGSLTKLFTSTLLAQMHIDGKIGLNDDIQANLPFSLATTPAISYQQLANHSSGLSKDVDDEEEFDTSSRADLENYLKHDLVLKYKQGTFHYSNTGMATLGYLISIIENKSYEKLLQEQIFNKLDMHHSTTIRANTQSTRVPALMSNDDPVSEAYKSVGGILSSVEDLYKFSLAFFGDSPEYLLTQKETLKQDTSRGVGLGWFINTNTNTDTNQTLYSHGGIVEGYRSVIILDKDKQNGIIILSNLPIYNNLGDISKLGRELMKKIGK